MNAMADLAAKAYTTQMGAEDMATEVAMAVRTTWCVHGEQQHTGEDEGRTALIMKAPYAGTRRAAERSIRREAGGRGEIWHAPAKAAMRKTWKTNGMMEGGEDGDQRMVTCGDVDEYNDACRVVLGARGEYISGIGGAWYTKRQARRERDGGRTEGRRTSRRERWCAPCPPGSRPAAVHPQRTDRPRETC